MAGGIGSMEFLVTQILLLFQKAIDGFGFSPTEQQLINHLKSENPGRTEHFCIIPKLGNITDFDPWQLPGEFTGQSILPSNSRGWWFICSQTQNQRARITRKTPCGSSWKVTGKPRDITIDGKKIGFKKILGFPEEKAKKDWIIHEYHLPQDSPNSGNNVLCHLMHKQDEKADNSTTGSEDGKFTLLEAEQWCNQFNDEPEGISPELHTISWPQLMQLLQRELESPSIHQFTNIGSLSAADLSQTKVQKGEEPRFEMVQQENGARNIEDEAAARAKLLQRGLQSPNNSSSSTIHQFTNIGSLSAADLSQTKVQKGEEPRFETFQQETGARNIEDEAAARAKNGQIFITANRQSIVEPLNCVFPPEERKGIPSNPFYSSGFLKFSEFEAYFDQPADQEKGLEHEEHNLAGNSPKRRRLDVSEENQIQ